MSDTGPLHRKRLLRLVSVGAIVLAALLLLSAIGQIFRDRWIVTALMMAIPLLPVGVVALMLDLSRRGRALAAIPFGLTVLALPAVGFAIYAGIGHGGLASNVSAQPLRILHWNVQWGGGRTNASADSFARQCKRLARQEPDIVVLSEGPRRELMPILADALGSESSPIVMENEPGASYWYRLAVASRWPVREEERHAFAHGVALSVIVEGPDRDTRVLAVDGVSTPTVSRLPLLREIDKLQRAARLLGQPYDAIVGDFNATSRSIGFDAFRGARYTLASERSRHWRATFPSYCPLYDIDHIWISPRWRVGGCEFFSQPSTTNHRGQIVQMTPPGVAFDLAGASD